MTLGVMIGIASLTVIVAIGEGTKVKVLSRIASLGFGPDSFSVYSGAGRLFRGRSRNTTSMTLQDADDIRAMPNVRMVVPRQRKRMKIIYKKEFTTTRVYGASPEWQPARQWKIVDGTFFGDADMERKRKVIVLGA
ncbi:MAG: ABC transporter permease, partial [Nitrospinae bacterium]|nr:ABC transporter permease [Nitrospinota bacterium]